MASTYEPIATGNATGSSPTFTFSSIPSTYTDLVVVTQNRIANTGLGFIMYFNGSNTNFSYTRILGNGTTASSYRDAIQDITTTDSSASSGLFTTHIINIMNYANTTTYKTSLWRMNNATNTTTPTFVGAGVGLWRSTAAITSVTFYAANGAAIDAGSTFTLYGIKAA